MKWVGYGLAALLLAAALGVGLSNVLRIHTRSALKATIADLDAKGVPTDMAKFLETERRSDVAPPAANPVESSSPKAANFLLSPEGQRQWPEMQRARELASILLDLTPEQEQEARAIVTKYADVLQTLYSLADSPLADPAEIGRRTGVDTDMPTGETYDWQACQWFTSLLFLNAYIAYRDDKGDDAVVGYSVLLRWRAHVSVFPLEEDPTSVLQFETLSGADERSNLWTLLAMALVDAPLSDRAADALETALERYPGHDVFVRSRTEEMLYRKIQLDRPAPRYPFLLNRIYWSPVLDFKRQYDEKRFLEAESQLLALSKLPYYEAWKPLLELRSSLGEPGWLTHPVAQWDLNRVLLMNSLQAKREVRVCQARVALALERFKRRQGAYPKDLAALTPEFLSSIPMDVSSGTDMPYLRREDGYVLYAAGDYGRYDLKTEGPDGSPITLITGPTVWPHDDWVWGVLEPAPGRFARSS